MLACVPDNTWDWRLWDLWGVGRTPDGTPMEEFERIVREAPGGFRFTCTALQDFAVGLEQIHDCLLTAARPGEEPTAEEVLAEDYRRLLLVISAEDSTSWHLTSHLSQHSGNLHSAWKSLAGPPPGIGGESVRVAPERYPKDEQGV